MPRCKSWVSQRRIVVDWQPSSACPTAAADMYIACQTGVLVHDDYCQQPVLQLIRGRLHSAAQLLDSCCWVSHTHTPWRKRPAELSSQSNNRQRHLNEYFKAASDSTILPFHYACKVLLPFKTKSQDAFVYCSVFYIYHFLCAWYSLPAARKGIFFKNIQFTSPKEIFFCCGILMKRKLESKTYSACIEKPVLYNTL